MSVRELVKTRMSELGIEPKKSLGQNFLVSDHVVAKITERVAEFSPKFLLEIGPGLGSLTSSLLKLKTPLQVIELDRNFASYWREQGLNVVEGDALQLDWDQFNGPTPKILVSNLPYQISSSLVIERCLDKTPFDGMVLMFQKEVAQKIRGTTKSELYGMLSVVAQTFFEVETLLEVSSGDFLPPPKVASRVLVFKPKASGVSDPERYLKFVKACFVQPRKLMISNIEKTLKLSRPELLATFKRLGHDEKVRAQQLSPLQLFELAQAMGYT